MPTYDVSWRETAYFYTQIEAGNAEEAKQKFDELYPTTDYTWIVDTDFHPQTLDIKEV